MTTSPTASSRDPSASWGSIEKASPVPYHYQLRQLLERAVTSGALSPGEQFPTEAALCERFAVSRTVVRQALSDLEREGLVTRMKGKGTFVSSPKVSERVLQSLTSFHEDMASKGARLETKVLRLEVEPVSAHVAEALELPESEQIVLVERLRLVDGQPLVLTTAHLPYSICAPVLALDLSQRSLFGIFEQELGYKLRRGTRTIEASLADFETAERLGIGEGAPVLILTGVTRIEDGRPIEYFVGVHRGDRSRFEVELVRPDEPRQG